MVKVKTMRNFWLAVFFLTILAGAAAPPAQAATVLTDIEGNWAYPEITYLVDKGVIYGYTDGTFKPNNSISRAEFIAMINRGFDFTATATISYMDVKLTDWFYYEIAKAIEAGYISGFPDGSMKPNNLISRQEAAAIMARILELDTSSSSSLAFTDAATIPVWSRNSIAAMFEAGYLSGYQDGSFRPLNNIKRAEGASIIYKGLQDRVPVSSLTLNESSATLYVGDTLTLTATLKPSDASNKKVNWSSSEENVATVSSTGKVIAQKEGNCIITATSVDGRFNDTCRINVNEPIRVEAVTLDESSVTIGVGRKITLYGSIDPDEATNQNVAWSSSNRSVATVSSTGQVTGVSKGKATIRVETEDGGYFDTCSVTVTDEGYLNLNLSSLTIYLDSTNPRTIYANLNGDSSDILGVIWESDDEEVATVSYDALALNAAVTGVDTGTCTISIEVVTEEGEYQDSVNIRVLD